MFQREIVMSLYDGTYIQLCVQVWSVYSRVLFSREIDWLFSSDNGRRQLAELTGK